jgi:hypothetical protein
VELILLDWTRMGRVYCLAGVIVQDGRYRVVRPLPARRRDAVVRNVGWSPFLFDGQRRWEAFELVRPEPAPPAPPHLEDVWVRDLRPTRRLADPAERRAILQATLGPADLPLFGAPLTLTRAGAYLPPGGGARSLASVTLPAAAAEFTVVRRDGATEADCRVRLPLPGLGPRTLPLKDHFLICRAEAAVDPVAQARALGDAVRGMGEQVLVRLGLSRPFVSEPGQGEGVCWLMADGFFSLTDPKP